MDYSQLILIVVMIAVFYFLMIRPENNRKKKAEEMRNSIRKGERITTIGGLKGRVVQVNDDSIVFETSEDRVRVEIAKWGIQSTESMEQAAAEKQSGGLFGKKKDDAAGETPKSDAPAEEAKKDDDKPGFDPEIK